MWVKFWWNCVFINLNLWFCSMLMIYWQFDHWRSALHRDHAKSDHMIQCYSNFLGSCVRNAENLSSLFVGPFRWLWMNSPWLNIIVPFDISLQASPLYTCLLNGLRAWSIIKLLIVRALNEKIVNFKYQIRNLRGWTLESSSSLKRVWTIPRFDLEFVETCIFESLTWV